MARKATNRSEGRARATSGRTRSRANTKSRGATSGSRAASAKSRTTTDHEEIRRWAESRGGRPACVRGTGGRGDIGMLRIDFPDGAEPSLEEISWQEWFDKFERNQLALVYQEQTSAGRPSRFNKIVSRETAAAKQAGGRKSAKTPKVRTAGGH